MGLFSLDKKFVQEKCALKISSPLSEDSLLVTTLEADEAISRPFEFRLGLLAEDVEIDPADLIGKEVCVSVKNPPSDSLLGGLLSSDKARYFHGIVSEFSAGVAVGDAKGFRAYFVTVVPQLWLLSRRTNCRIFQEKTVVEIIQAVLSDHGLRSGTDFSTSGVSGPPTKYKWDYCVQYRESDLAFISRLMEHLGIYYYFEHTKSGHKLILSDADPLNSDTIDVVHKEFSRIEDEDDQLTAWRHQYSIESESFVVTDFDYRKTSADLSANVSGAGKKVAKKLEVYEYPGYYQTTKADEYGAASDGKRLAKTHLESLEIGSHLIHGSSNSRKLVAGCRLRLKIEDKPLADDDREKFLITSVHHSYRQVIIPVGGHVGALSYSNQFVCIPAKTTFRPPRITPKPVVEGPQTAIVIGSKAFDAKSKSNQEVMTDKLGRVKVQFHWDRRDGRGEKKFEQSSCWIRVSQGHAGAGWGMINIPRKGEEVIVSFLEGDPDQPIITGRVYNGQNAVPYKLDDKKEKDNIYISGFKSRSSLDGDVTKNFNELRFQDKLGKEHIYFHAERDFTRVVENKDILVVSDKKEITEQRLEKISKETKDGSQTIEIFKHRNVRILTGDEALDVEEGNRTVTIKKGNDHHEVQKGNRTAKISKGNDQIEVSEGDRIIEIKKGEHKLDVAKDISVTSGQNININAENDTILLKVGQSSITLKKDGSIDISGQKITVNGTTIAVEAKQKISLNAKQAISVDALQKIDIKAMQKTTVEGTMGLALSGLKIDLNGNLMTTAKAGVMAEVSGSAMAKIKGAITFVG